MSAHLAPPPAPAAFTPTSRALAAAMGAPALRRHGCAAQVLVILHEILTPFEFRAVPPWYVAQRLGIHRVQASRTLSHLATHGLLIRGARSGIYPTFRLPLDESASAPTSTPTAA